MDLRQGQVRVLLEYLLGRATLLMAEHDVNGLYPCPVDARPPGAYTLDPSGCGDMT
jgi:hypothetical protein